MKKSLLFVCLLALAACQTPREACISDATRDLNVVRRLISETEANIARGYGLEERQVIETVPDVCVIRDADGNELRHICEQQEITTIEEPVALDLNAERAKLASLRQQEAQMQRQSQAAIQFCVANYADA